jgi:cobalt-zinc-cadmium efflux system protein
MSHDHAHNHGGTMNYNRAFGWGIVLNVLFVIVETTYGIYADSLALIADAGHNLSDVFSLLLAWGAYYLSQKAPTDNRTYGLKKVTVLASLLSTLLLIGALGVIFYEAIERLREPQSVSGLTVIIVAAVGVVINTATALLFMRGQKEDLNVKAAYMHMVADAAVSVGVVAAGAVIFYTGWYWVDPVISMFIVLFVFWGTWGLLKDSVNLSIDAVPRKVNVQEVRAYLLSLPNIVSLHDLHIWPMSTTQTALSVHLVTTEEKIDNALITKIQEHLSHTFGIEHVTVQVEKESVDFHCALEHEI